MDQTYQVKLTEQAQEQLFEIVRYITYQLQEPEIARKLATKLEDAMNSLERLPKRIALTEEEPWRSEGVHKMPVKNFLVYFWVDDAQMKVQIVAVIYGRRDQVKQLSQISLD